MKSKKFIFMALPGIFLFLLLSFSNCKSQNGLYHHQAGELASLKAKALETLPDQSSIKWKNSLPLVLNLFDYTAGNPCGAYYCPGQGLQGPLYQIYSQKNLEYPLFEFFWEGLLQKGFWTLKNYYSLSSPSLKALAVIRGRITRFEIDSLHQWEEGLERLYWLGLIEGEFEMEGKGEPAKFTLSHRFKVRQRKGVDILRALVYGLVGQLVESEAFQQKTGILPQGRTLRRIKKGPSHEK